MSKILFHTKCNVKMVACRGVCVQSNMKNDALATVKQEKRIGRDELFGLCESTIVHQDRQYICVNQIHKFCVFSIYVTISVRWWCGDGTDLITAPHFNHLNLNANSKTNSFTSHRTFGRRNINYKNVYETGRTRVRPYFISFPIHISSCRFLPVFKSRRNSIEQKIYTHLNIELYIYIYFIFAELSKGMIPIIWK